MRKTVAILYGCIALVAVFSLYQNHLSIFAQSPERIQGDIESSKSDEEITNELLNLFSDEKEDAQKDASGGVSSITSDTSPTQGASEEELGVDIDGQTRIPLDTQESEPEGLIVESPKDMNAIESESVAGQSNRRTESLLDMVGPSGKKILGSEPEVDPETPTSAPPQSANYLEMIGPTGRKIGESGTLGYEDTGRTSSESSRQSLAGLRSPSGKPLGVVGVSSQGTSREFEGLIEENQRGRFGSFVPVNRIVVASGVETIFGDQLFNEIGSFAYDTRIEQLGEQHKIVVNIPKRTTFRDHTNSIATMGVAPPIISSRRFSGNSWGKHLVTLQYGLENGTITFYDQNSKRTTIEMGVRVDDTWGLEVGDRVMINSSSDGNNWIYHASARVIEEGGTLMIYFETDHLTYFNVSAMRGDFSINNDDVLTTTENVTLTMGITGATLMRFGDTEVARDAAAWEAYADTRAWTLPIGDGKKTVYAAFQNTTGDVITVLDDIVLNTALTVQTNFPVDSARQQIRYDGSDITTFTTGAFGVSQWADKGGRADDATQALTGGQPTLTSESNSPFYSLAFDGVDDYLAITRRIKSRYVGVTVCGVFSSTVGGSNRALIDYDPSRYFSLYLTGDGVGFAYTTAGGSSYQLEATGSGRNDGNRHAVCARFDRSLANDTALFVDGQLVAEANFVGGGNANRLGDNSNAYGFLGDSSLATTFDGTRANEFYEGNIQEIVWFNEAKDNATIDGFMCYWADKRGISMSICPDDIAPIASVVYDFTGSTTKPITATLTGYSEDIVITNNGGSSMYLFTGNGQFTFEFQDTFGNTGFTMAQVDWFVTGSITVGVGSGVYFSGLETSSIEQVFTGQFVDYLTLTDTLGYNSGYYTTLEMSVLSGVVSTIASSNFERYATGITLLSGDSNPGVVVATGFQSYVNASSPVTFIKRDPAANGYLQGRYGARPFVRFTLPPFTSTDTYVGIITYTLYEN